MQIGLYRINFKNREFGEEVFDSLQSEEIDVGLNKPAKSSRKREMRLLMEIRYKSEVGVMYCPCHSSKKYQECCQPYHHGKSVPDALALMRSRFSGYAMNLADYIIQTTHPNNPSYEKDHKKWKKEIESFSKHTEFKGLKILDVQLGVKRSTVTFIATLEQGGRDASFKEKSQFLKVNGKWLYYSGEPSENK